MLQIMRKAAGSWVGVGILGLAAGALVITLFQPSGPTGGGAAGAVLATVGERPIHEADYMRMIDRAVAMEREHNEGITTPDFLRLGGGEVVLQQLIQGKAVEVYATRNDMVVSRRMVDGEIASIPALQVNGEFDEGTFRRLLAEQRISEEDLRAGIVTDLQRRQLLQPIAFGTSVPAGMAEPFARLLLEQRRGQILAIPSAAMPDPGQPTDTQLQEYYEASRRAYTLPERRAFRYAILEPDSLTEKAKPTEAEIAAYYKDHAADYGGVETRNVRQIVLRDEKAATDLVAKVRGGRSFTEVAAEHGWSAADTDLGQVNKAGLAEQTSQPVADAAFGLGGDSVSNPIETPLGYYVVQVTKITPPSPRPLESVSAEIEKRLLDEKLQDMVLDAIATSEDKLAEGEPLTDVAADLGLELQNMEPTTADGRQYSSDYTVTAINRPELLTRVFAALPDDGPQVVDLGNNRFALFELTETVAPVLVPLADIKEDVVLAWQVKARSDAARAMAEKIATASGEGGNLAEAASGNKLPAPQELTVRRLELSQMMQQGQEVPAPVTMLLNLPVGKARTLAAPGGQGWFVVRVDAIEQGDLAETPQLTNLVRQNMQRESADEMVGTFLRVVEREAGVVRRPDAITAVNRRMAGSGDQQP